MTSSAKALLGVIVLACAVLAACTEHAPDDGNNDNNWFSVSLPQGVGPDLDLLFVIDNSPSMLNETNSPFVAFGYPEAWPRGLNLHVGVTTSDLGAGPYTTIRYCEDAGGDGGVLGMISGFDRAEDCVGLSQRYMVDVEPVNCTIEKDESSACTSHSCVQADCDAMAQGDEVLYLATDGNGCPRCRNYTVHSTLEDTGQCLVDVGPSGCGFQQPLEAMYQALNNNPDNTGFLRNNAHLAIIFITNSEDCSASDPGLFDPGQDSIDSTLGYFSGFRCFEFGVTCDIDDRTQVGLRRNCRPRDDQDALLHPISRYVQSLGENKDPEMLVIAALAGPAEDWSVTVGRDWLDRPVLELACGVGGNDAQPAIRLKALVDAFNREEDMAWAYAAFCGDRYSWISKLQEISERIQMSILQCLPAPLTGCADVGVEFGSPQAEQTCDINSRCLPECLVTDVFERGTANEQRTEVPHCLDVLPDGTVSPGNTDRSVAYSEGRPDDRDPNLPVSACWQIVFNENCPDSNYARLTISRRADPPPRSFAEITCRQIDQQEKNCDDGKDNDEDCLVDEEDPDC